MIIGAVRDMVGFIVGGTIVLAVKERIPSLDPHSNMSSAKFEYYLNILLNLDELKDEPKVLLVMDNATYHQKKVRVILYMNRE